MPRTTRTFVAVAVPDDRAAKLGRLQGQLAPDLPGVRWVDPSQFHATLAFLGDVPDTDLDQVCRAVAAAAAPFEPLDLTLEGLGAFPTPARPRTVWVALTGPGVEALNGLQKAIAQALIEARYPPDGDRFQAHVTLGRIKDRGRRGKPTEAVDLTQPVHRHKGWSAGSFRVTEVVTFGSTLTPDGPVYAPLCRAPLRGRNPEGKP